MRELFAAKRVRGTKIDYRHWAFRKDDLDEYYLPTAKNRREFDRYEGF